MISATQTQTRTETEYWVLAGNEPPEQLADRLNEAKIAKIAAHRIESFERLKRQHAENRKAGVKLALGMLGLGLGLSPAIANTSRTCWAGSGRPWSECASQLSSILGLVLALGVSIWSGLDIYNSPIRMADNIKRYNEELDRAMHRKNGESQSPQLFDIYQHMTYEQRVVFKQRLHFHARHARLPQGQGEALDPV